MFPLIVAWVVAEVFKQDVALNTVERKAAKQGIQISRSY